MIYVDMIDGFYVDVLDADVFTGCRQTFVESDPRYKDTPAALRSTNKTTKKYQQNPNPLKPNQIPPTQNPN